MNKTAIITAVQMNSQQDIEQNLATAHQAVIAAKQQGSSLVVLPENVCSMGEQNRTAYHFDELSSNFSQIAQQQQIYLVAGTLPCHHRPDGSRVDNDKLRQVSQLFAPDGSLVARYDKIHLFKATVDDATVAYDESQIFEAGTNLVVAPINLEGQRYHLGMMVCFDLRFPSMAQRLRQFGADMLSVPSAFTYATGQAHWSLLLKARALDSQCLVIGSAQGGMHDYTDYQNSQLQQQQGEQIRQTRQTWGHSMIAQSDGSLLAEYNDSQLPMLNEDGARFYLVNTQFDPIYQQKQRHNLPTFDCHQLV